MNDTVISVKGLSKKYRLYDSPRDRMKEALHPFRKRYHREFWALKDVSFEIKKGETIGIVGKNGSGKSTLLQIICGVLQQTEGELAVSGNISALLELGAGFNPEFTGRQNVYLNGAIKGFTKEQIDERMDAILGFADIGDFIDQPVKTYSSGMYVRLAFSAAVNIEPDILIVDEALSVGDVFFQNKCFMKFKEFQEKGVTILFVSHSLDTITAHCTSAILIDAGKLISSGSPKQVVDDFRKTIALQNKDYLVKEGKANAGRVFDVPAATGPEWQNLFTYNPKEGRFGTKEVEILEGGIFTPENAPAVTLETNKEYVIKIKLIYNEAKSDVIAAFVIKDLKGTVLCGTNTYFQNFEMAAGNKGDFVIVSFKLKMPLNPGQYLLSLGSQAINGDGFLLYDQRIDYLAFQVVGKGRRWGIFDTDSVIECEKL